MLPRPLSFRGRAFLGLAALALSLFFATALPAESPRPEQILTLGQETQEQPIKAGEAHPWRVAVPPGTSVLVTIDQRSIGLVAEALEPGGGKPMVFGAGNDRWGPVVLLLETAGDYRIEVRPREKGSWPGRYTMRAEAVPSAGERHDALALMSRAGREVASGAPESRKQATASYGKALADWHALGDEHAWEAEALTCMAMLEDLAKEYKPAAEDLSTALALWKEVGNPRREAETSNWLAVLYLEMRDSAKTRKVWESARDLWHGLGEEIEEAQIQGNLCYLDQQAGSLKDALTCFQKSLDLFRGKDAKQEAELLNVIGGIYTDLGEPDAALDSYQQALHLWQTLGDRDKEATLLNNIGYYHRTLGEWQEALRFYDRAWEALSTVDNRALAGSVLNNIGFVYNVLGEPQRALSYLDKALKLHREVGIRQREITTLNNLGTAWRGLGDWKKALDAHRQALKIAGALQDLQQQAGSHLSIAEIYLDRGHPAAALREVDTADRLLGEKGGPGTHLKLLHLRGKALTLAGRARKALPVLQQALAGRRELRDRAGEAETLEEIVLAERSLGLTGDALSHAEAAADAVEGIRSAFLGAESLRASFLATRRQSFSLLIDLLMARHAGEEAFEVSERARARSILDVLRAGGAGSASGAPLDLRERRNAFLRRLSAKVDKRWQASGAQAEALEKEIKEILTQVDGVEAEIRGKDSRFADFSAPRPVSAREIADELEPGTMLLEYSLGEERSVLWAIEPGRVRSFLLPPQSEIEPLARRAYKEMSTSESGGPHRGEALETLSRKLLAPVWEERTRGGALLQRLVVVPDGALVLLPFATLPVPDPGRTWKSPGALLPLLERVEVVSIPSATTLAVQRQRTRQRAPAPQWAAVFGDPVYAADDPRLAHRAAASRPQPAKKNGASPAAEPAGRGGNGRAFSFALPRLRATGKEAEAIRDLAPAGKVKLGLGLDATREAVLAGNLRDYQVLHFATHAIADTENPELSGLWLSRVDADGRPREGFLGLSDIYDLDLGAGLVVLSGCRTALGKEVRGEGLIGLTRAFQYAGAPRVVASLWPVDDRATAELMKRFYKAMWRDGRTPAAALREAQRSLRQDPRFRDPHSWAGFVFQGDWLKDR